MTNFLPKLRPTRPSHYAMIALLIIGAFFRLWNFVPGLMFQGDQGRDAIIARNILINHDPVLIGPVTSTGNMYLGPLYYYLMVPFLALSYPSPVGPALMIAALSILTIGLIYWLGKELVGRRAAVLAAALFTFCTVAIIYARFSWNPNPAPLVSMILVWAVYRAIHRKHWYWVLAAGCIAVLIQLHYVILLTIPATGILWLTTLIGLIKEELSRRSGPAKRETAALQQSTFRLSLTTSHFPLATFGIASIVALALFIASFAPLVVFDLRHQGLNAKAFQSFLTQDQGTVNPNSPSKLLKALKETHGRSLQIFGEQFFGKNRILNTILVLAVIIGLCYFWQARDKDKWHSPEFVLINFLGWAIIGLAFYQSSVFDHYILYLLPITFLTYGLLGSKIWPYKWGKAVTTIFVVGFVGYSVTHLPLKSAGWQITDIKATAETILAHVQPGEKYNIVLLSGSGDIDGQNYRYFLETSDKPPVPTERRGEVQTLFIINEDRQLKKVTDSPIYEIVVFPDKQPADVYTIPNGPEITILRKKS